MIKIYGNKNYKGKWVAIKDFETKPKVVVYTKTLQETLEKAERRI